MLEFLRKLVPWVLAGMLFGWGWQLGADSMDAKWKQEVQNEYVKRVEATASTQRAINEISSKYQEDLAALEGSTDRIISDLRSDNKRLRVKLKPQAGVVRSDGGCESASTGELDESTSRRLIGITQRGDAQIEALIKTVKELQAERNVK